MRLGLQGSVWADRLGLLAVVLALAAIAWWAWPGQ